MIRVYKSPHLPTSLEKQTGKQYNNEDVKAQLVKDQHCKCYLCEQDTGKDFEIEHLTPQKSGINQTKEWNNLLLSCPYCNKKKSDKFNILNPLLNNIEDIIEQRIVENHIYISSSTKVQETEQTVILLNNIFNGLNNIRDTRANRLFKDVQRELNFFMRCLLNFKQNPSPENKGILTDSLKVDKEFLGFKYWIIKDSGLEPYFKDAIQWNKA
jgi:uncharacterized protein (TIGR02646 family)